MDYLYSDLLWVIVCAIFYRAGMAAERMKEWQAPPTTKERT